MVSNETLLDNASSWIGKLVSLQFLLLVVVVVVIGGSSSTEAFQTGRPNHRRHSIRTVQSKSIWSQIAMPRRSATSNAIALDDYLDRQIEDGYVDSDLGSVLLGVAQSCAEVSKLLQTHTLDYNDSHDNGVHPVVTTTVNVQGEEQKKMDVVANDIFVRTLGSIDSLVAMASEEEESIIYSNDNHDSAPGKKYEIAFDPLDGSGNLDVNLPTGSIFGIAESKTDQTPFSRPGTSLVASGYALYSSSTELVISLGKDHPDGVLGFTLVHNATTSAFVLSRTNLVCPPHGPYYSLNEAREPDWPQGLQRWIHDAKRGRTTTGHTYSSRYVCSLCADFHRTLLQGGWAGNPRPHLRLLYEAAPLAFVVETAGGNGTDGTLRLLEIVPQGLHDRVSVFLGSAEDIADLQSYGDIQQVQNKKYSA